LILPLWLGRPRQSARETLKASIRRFFLRWNPVAVAALFGRAAIGSSAAAAEKIKEIAMMKHILATTALATLLATGLQAQTEPATDPAQDPAAPIVEGEGGTMGAPVGVEGAEETTPEVVQDEPLAPDSTTTPDVAQDAEPMEDAVDPMIAEPMDDAADPMVAEDWAPIDLTTISSEQLIGADIVTYDNETIATIEDVLISDDGQVENLVARFGGFLGFGSNSVLLTVDEVEVMQEADESLLVRTNLTPEGIETRPVYEEEAVEG